MTHSLIGADRSTHFKIVAVALVSVVVVVLVGITARVAETDTATARIQAEGPVLKAESQRPSLPAMVRRSDNLKSGDHDNCTWYCRL